MSSKRVGLLAPTPYTRIDLLARPLNLERGYHENITLENTRRSAHARYRDD